MSFVMDIMRRSGVSAPIGPQPFAYYPLKDNGNEQIGTIGGINITPFNITFDGTWANFNGSTSYGKINDNPNFTFNNGSIDTPYTIEFEMKLFSLVNQTIIAKREELQGAEYQLRYLNGNMFRWQIFTSWVDKIVFDTQTILNTNTIYKVKITSNGNFNSTKIYVNDVEQPLTITHVGNYIGMPNTIYPLYVGGYPPDWIDFNGSLKNLKFYNEVI
jgi:hypothetical protein